MLLGVSFVGLFKVLSWYELNFNSISVFISIEVAKNTLLKMFVLSALMKHVILGIPSIKLKQTRNERPHDFRMTY